MSRIDLNTLPPIMVEDKTIPFVNEVRNLGVIMTANLSWRIHVMSVSRRVHFSSHKFKFHRNTLSRELRTSLIVSLTVPPINYCCLVFKDLTNEMNTKLQQLINCGIRFIFYLRRDVHISPYRRSLGWLSVKSRRLYFLDYATFNIIQGKAPSYLLELFDRHIPSQHPSRQCVPNNTFIVLIVICSSHLLIVHQPIKLPSTRLQFIFGTLLLHWSSPHPRLKFLSHVYMTIWLLSRTSNPS